MIHPRSNQSHLFYLLEEKEQVRALYDSAKGLEGANAARLRSELMLVYNRALREFNQQLLVELADLETISREITREMRPYVRQSRILRAHG